MDHFRRSVPTLVERAHQVVADGTARRLADKCLDDAIQEVRDDLLATPNVRPEMMTQPAGRHPPNGASGAGDTGWIRCSNQIAQHGTTGTGQLTADSVDSDRHSQLIADWRHGEGRSPPRIAQKPLPVRVRL